MGSSGGFRARPSSFRPQTQEEKGEAIKFGVGDVEGAERRLQQVIAGTEELGTGQNVGQRRESKRTQELTRIGEEAEISRIQRELDFARGRERAEQDFGEGALGRIRQQRSADIANIIAQRRDVAEQGFGAEAFQAAREQGQAQLRRQQALQQRQLS